MGAREARVVLLGLNPRFDPAFLVEDASILGWVKRGLSLEQTTHPYWLLRDEFFKQALAKWDRRILSPLLAICREDRARLARSLMLVNFHGYVSTNYTPIPITLPSQHFGFALVRDAISRGSAIVVARGWFEWSMAVPELTTSRRCC